jgi:hypothetical protein
MIMADSEDHPVLALYQSINLAVVEVRVGETRKEAWRRYIAEHPESAGVDVKIFHYPNPNRDKT